MDTLSKFNDNKTKANFGLLLDETIITVQKLLKSAPAEIYVVILSELEDIKETIVTLGIPLDEDEIYQRYSLGSIAIKNLESDSDLYKRITTLFYGVSVYSELS